MAELRRTFSAHPESLGPSPALEDLRGAAGALRSSSIGVPPSSATAYRRRCSESTANVGNRCSASVADPLLVVVNSY